MPKYGISVTRIFSYNDRIREPKILPTYGKISVSEKPYSSSIYAVVKKTTIMTLENEWENIIVWFKLNNMIVNPKIFQSMILQKIWKQKYNDLKLAG